LGTLKDDEFPYKSPTVKVTASFQFDVVVHSNFERRSRRGATLLTGTPRNKERYLSAAQLLGGLAEPTESYGGALQPSVSPQTPPKARVAINPEEAALAYLSTNDSHTAEPIAPPILLQIALRVLLPAKVRDAVLGDAQEAYNDTLRERGWRQPTTSKKFSTRWSAEAGCVWSA
jgi:hypothetical protein